MASLNVELPELFPVSFLSPEVVISSDASIQKLKVRPIYHIPKCFRILIREVNRFPIMKLS